MVAMVHIVQNIVCSKEEAVDGRMLLWMQANLGMAHIIRDESVKIHREGLARRLAADVVVAAVAVVAEVMATNKIVA